MVLKNINSILIITLSNIGDVILTTPVIDILKKRFPKAQIDIISGPRAVGLFSNDLNLRHAFSYNKFSPLKDKIKFISYLRKQKYDLVIDLKDSVIPLFLNARYRSAFFKIKNNKEILHMKDKHLKKMEKFDLDLSLAQFYIYISEEDKLLAANKLKDIENEKLVAISPGARSEIKRWSKDGFITVTKWLIDCMKCKVVLVGDKDDLKLGEEILSSLSSKPLNLITETNLPQLAYVLKKASLLLTNDSACLHMASAVGTKTLAIFGPTDPKKYGPLAKGSIVIRKNLFCSPCQVAQCRFNLECMKKIKPEEVIDKMKDMI